MEVITCIYENVTHLDKSPKDRFLNRILYEINSVFENGF